MDFDAACDRAREKMADCSRYEKNHSAYDYYYVEQLSSGRVTMYQLIIAFLPLNILYRVTIQVVQNLPLTLIYRLCFIVMSLY